MTKPFYETNSTRTLEEWADYISSDHEIRNPNVYPHVGKVVRVFNNPNLRGFTIELTSTEEPGCYAFVSTRYMPEEKYLAIENLALMAFKSNLIITIVGALGYDWTGAQITQVERVAVGENGLTLTERLIEE